MPRIFLDSFTVLISSPVEPSSAKESILGRTLKAIVLPKTSPTAGHRVRPAELLDLIVELLDLLGELARPVSPRARDGLVRREDQRAETGGAMQRGEGHHRHDRRAVGNGDDLRRSLERLRVHLGHDERHVRLHPERG